MTKRRAFLQGAAALSAVPLASKAGFTSAYSGVDPGAVLIDSRHQCATAFAQRAEQLGASVRRIQGDITAVWQNELLPLWRQRKAHVLVGLTERPALFLLERLAWEHGLRVSFEAEHDPSLSSSQPHQLIRHNDPSLLSELMSSTTGWPAILADSLLVGRQQVADNSLPTDAAMAAHYGEQTKLYSWIIAPRTTA